MKYHQWNLNQNSIFHELNALTPNGLFEILGVEQMELLFSIKHGGRTILSSLESVNTSVVATMIHRMYYDKWLKLSEIYLNDFEVGFDGSSTTSSTDEKSSLKELTSSSNNEVSAYNDDEMVEVSGTGESINEVGSVDSNKNTTVTTKSLKSVDLQRVLLENSNINKLICDDIANVISLPIY